MKPYYQDDSVTLYHGDCLEITEWLAADGLVTDPPYGIGWKQGDYSGSNIHGGRRREVVVHHGIANDVDTATRDAALKLWGQKPSVVFGSFRSTTPTEVIQTLVWKKPEQAGVVGSTTGYRNDVELIFLRGDHIRRVASRSSVITSQSLMGRQLYGHPHSKPVGVLEHIIGWLPPGTITDPFAGSGSALIAARNLGRKAIGVELDERYCELIAKRLDQMCLDFGGAS